MYTKHSSQYLYLLHYCFEELVSNIPEKLNISSFMLSSEKRWSTIGGFTKQYRAADGGQPAVIRVGK